MINDNAIKIKSTNLTPVRYPGGKSRALRYLHPFLMEKVDFSEYREPFIGGGSVALYLMQYNKDANYWINDLFYPVYCFWKVLYTQSEKMSNFILAKRAQADVGTKTNAITIENGIPTEHSWSNHAENGRAIYQFCREAIQKSQTDKDEFKTACYWFILNKLSFSGLSMIGSYSPLAFDQNFSKNSCGEKLINTSKLMHTVKNLKITNLDYLEVLKNCNKKTFVYADPPYNIKDFLYGDNGNMHKGFDHQKFKDTIAKCQANWVISYNNNPSVSKMFDGFRREKFKLKYTMNVTQKNGINTSKSGKSAKDGKELIILNY